jgi:hypothetical protein
MEAGISFLVAGSWQKPVGDVPGSLVASNGLVSATFVSRGIVDLRLLYPVNEESIACVVTQRGIPTDAFYSVTQTDNRTKRVTFKEDSEDFVDVSFDFLFVKMAQPTQGGLG